MDTTAELFEPDIYSPTGDTVTLTMSAEEFRYLVGVISRAVASFERAGDYHMALMTMNVNNFIQHGNRNHLPIPRG